MGQENSSELESLWEEAGSHIKSGRQDKAIEIYKYILLRYSDDTVAAEYANAYLGDLYLSLKQLDLAEKHIRKAISFQPEKSVYHYLLGFNFSYQYQWEQAIDEFKKALTGEPQNGEYMRGLGWATYETGSKLEGIEILLQADKLDPDNVRILTDLAVAYMPLDLLKAKNQAEKALKIDPEDQLARNVLDKILLFEEDFNQGISNSSRVQYDESSSYAYGIDIFQFKVSPQTNPDTWRIIEIKGNQLLSSLHKGIAQAFELNEKQTHSFLFHREKGKLECEFASKVPGISGTHRTTKNIRVDSIGLFQDEEEKFRYLYDYEKMSWYEVVLVKVDFRNTRAKFPRVVKKLSKYPGKRKKEG